MSHMSLLRYVLTLIVCLQKAYVEGGHRSRRVEVPQNQGGHYHVLLRAMLLCPCTLGCRRSVCFLRQACVLRRVARNQDASNGWRVPRRFQVTFHKYDYQGRHATQVRLSSPRPVLQVLTPYKVRRSSTASQASVFIYAFTQGPHQDRKHVYGKRFLPVLHLGHSQATYSALISWNKGMCI